MIPFFINPTGSDNTAVTASSGQNSTIAMVATGTYLFLSDVSCYLAQGANPTASAADGSMLVPAGVGILLRGSAGAKIAVIASSASTGNCSLSPVGA
jgi:hypothetical protein